MLIRRRDRPLEVEADMQAETLPFAARACVPTGVTGIMPATIYLMQPVAMTHRTDKTLFAPAALAGRAVVVVLLVVVGAMR